MGLPAIQACKINGGCNRLTEFRGELYCNAYEYPIMKWRLGHCPLASHLPKEESPEKKAMNALKASKRRARGR